MEHHDTLLTLAEIAVALAGFTGLVSVIGRHDRPEASLQTDRSRLRMMLEVSMRNAAFALLPIPFLDLTSSETIIWRIASGVYLVAVPAHLLFRRRQGSVAGIVSGKSLPLLPVSLLACMANVIGLGGPHAFSLYILSLLLGLFSAGMLFVSVAGSSFSDERS